MPAINKASSWRKNIRKELSGLNPVTPFPSLPLLLRGFGSICRHLILFRSSGYVAHQRALHRVPHLFTHTPNNPLYNGAPVLARVKVQRATVFGQSSDALGDPLGTAAGAPCQGLVPRQALMNTTGGIVIITLYVRKRIFGPNAITSMQPSSFFNLLHLLTPTVCSTIA